VVGRISSDCLPAGQGGGAGQRAGRCDAMRADGEVGAGAGEAAAPAAVPLSGRQVVRRVRISWIVLHQAE
jgi:hypothetical protein